MKFTLIKGKKAYELSKGDFIRPIVEIPHEFKGLPVTRIGGYAFYNSKKLVKVIIPSSVNTIEKCAFSGCVSLKSADLPDSLTHIKERAFSRCSKLIKVYLSGRLKELGDNAFFGCSSIKNILLPQSLESIGEQAFSYCESLIEINIPKNDKLTTLREELFYNCKKLKKVLLFSNITKLDKGVFYNCESLEVDLHFLPSSIQEIPDDLFHGCKRIKALELSDNVTKLGISSFYNCDSLKTINIPHQVTIIPKDCFCLCSSLNFIHLHDGIESIQEGAFGSTKITSIKIPPKVQVITKESFTYCVKLINVEIPNSVIRIEEEAFSSCYKLKTITLPLRLEYIEKKAFALCFDLVVKYLPNDFVKIAEDAFWTVHSPLPTEIDPAFFGKSTPIKEVNSVKKENSILSSIANFFKGLFKTTIEKEEVNPIEESIKDNEPDLENKVCSWCEKESPNVEWHNDANPDAPICDDCYKQFLKKEKSDKKLPNIRKEKTMINKHSEVLDDLILNRMIKEGRADAIVLYGLKLLGQSSHAKLGINLITYCLFEFKSKLALDVLTKLGLADKLIEMKKEEEKIEGLNAKNLASLGVTIDSQGHIHFKKDSYAASQYQFTKLKYGYKILDINFKNKLKHLRVPDFLDNEPIVEIGFGFFENLDVQHLYLPKLIKTLDFTNYSSMYKKHKVKYLYMTSQIQEFVCDSDEHLGLNRLEKIEVEGFIPDISSLFDPDLDFPYDEIEINYNKPYKIMPIETIVDKVAASKILVQTR
jgi:hypothetical protein